MSENNKNITIFVISDSAGETASKLAQATMAQYPTVDFELIRRTFIQNQEALNLALNDAKSLNAMVIYTIINPDLVQLTQDFCEENQLYSMNVLTPPVEEVAKRTGVKPTGEPGALHHLNKNYFKRIKAMEFAVKYDDGKDPRGLLKADLVLVGISRTSKTPLSMYLANKHIKVANVPLVPEVPIPKELDGVEPRRIIGLTNSPEKLNVIRTERLKAMGLNGSANYAKLDRILEELDYSEEVMKRLKCPVINVANKAIEETAGIILDILKENDVDILKDYEI